MLWFDRKLNKYLKMIKNNRILNFAVKAATKTLESASNQDTVVSPLGIAIALSMLYKGSAGSTKKEMEWALTLGPNDDKELDEHIQKWTTILKDNDVNIANGMWANGNNILHPEFIKSMQKYYDAESSSLEFSNIQSVKDINNWVNTKTDGCIDEIISSLSSQDKVVIANAIKVKKEWLEQFNPSNTTIQAFYLKDGTIKGHKSMTKKSKYKVCIEDNFSYIEIPYKDNLRMHTVMPKKAGAMLRNFSIDNLNKVKSKATEQEIILNLPKFNVDSTVDLKHSIAYHGISKIFGNSADLSGMSPMGKELFISALNQRNNIEVNEKGTKLASSTVAVAGCKGIYRPLSIEINRPFIFAICSHGIDAPLLIGHITGSNF